MPSDQDLETLINETIDSLKRLLSMLYDNINASSTVTINPTPPGPINPTPSGLNPTPISQLGNVQTCVLISKIIDEKPGAILNNVVLTVNDFNILKQNDHVFTVIPPNPAQFQGIPTIGIDALTKWIANNSVTNVPDVPADDV